MKKKLTIVFLVWFVLGITIEIVMGQLDPVRGGKPGTFFDHLLVTVPFFAFIAVGFSTLASKIKSKLLKSH